MSEIGSSSEGELKRKRSVIWKFFTGDGVEGKCNTCGSKTKTGATTNMINHLALHPTVHSEYMKENEKTKERNKQVKLSFGSRVTGQIGLDQPTLKESIEKSQMLASSSKRGLEITEKICLMIARDFQPYSIVEDAGFRDLIHTLEPRYELPSRTTFSRKLIPNLYEKTKQKVQKEMQEAIIAGVSSLTYTSDGWTSRARDSYISLTCHYLKNDFTPCNFVLANSPMAESHTAENLLQKLEVLEKEWAIPNTGMFPIYVVADNAANIKSALKKSNWIPVQCFAHTLQLAINDAKKDTPGMVALCSKAKGIVGHFHRSTFARHKLSILQTQMQKPNHEMIQSCETRWSSEYEMLSRLAEQREPVSAYLSSDESSTSANIENLTTSEWRMASGYICALNPLAEATAIMSGQAYPTLSLTIPILHGVTSTIKKHISSASAGHGIIFSRNLLKAINIRFPNLCKDGDLPTFAMLVDPRFKAIILTEREKNDVIKNLLDSCTPQLEPVEEPVSPTSPEPSSSTSSLWDDFDQLLSSHRHTSEVISPSPLEIELRQYCAEDVIPRKACPYSWWRENRSRFPKLSSYARHYLAIPGSQVSSERLFSTAGNIVTVRRTALLPEHVEQLTFLNGNLN